MTTPSFLKLSPKFTKLAVSACSLAAVAVGCAAPASDDGMAASEIKQGEEPKTPAPTPTVPAANPLPTQWTGNGSSQCRNFINEDPTITKFQYDENTYILRENKCLNYEGNFIHLLFGHDKVLMQDTGSIPRGMNAQRFAQSFPIRDTVEGIIAEWLAAHPNADGTPRARSSIELLVTHSHSHGDHVQGDFMFKQANGQPYPYTRIAGLRPAEVANFFGITDWPNTPASIDLGNRKLEVMGLPGHEESHIAIYDHGSHLLLTGDSLYPGHLFINNWAKYRASVARLESWVAETDAKGAPLRPIAHVFGTHIEKAPEDGKFYTYGSSVHEPERKLELTRGDVAYLAQQIAALGPTAPAGREIKLANFCIEAQ